MRSIISRLSDARVYELGNVLEPQTPVSPNHPPFRMALTRRHGDVMREDADSGASELISMGGHTGTHIDALCHVSHDLQLFGGIDARAASDGGRFHELGVETIPPIVCRGVLLDVPGALGRPTLDAAERITADLLSQTCEAEGVTIEPGDAVLIRSGWPIGRYSEASAYVGWNTGVPGPDESGARWLANRRVRLTGGDTIAYEWLAQGAGHSRLPVHRILLVENGICLLEAMRLEEIAANRVFEFLFVTLPLRIVGATASPVRPVAIVVE
jgi:kynurenine formamidase